MSNTVDKGSKKLDTDLFIRTADLNLNTALSHSKLSDKEKLEVKERYASMIKKIRNGEAYLDEGNILVDLNGNPTLSLDKILRYISDYLNYVHASIPEVTQKKKQSAADIIFDPNDLTSVQGAWLGYEPTYYILLDAEKDGKRGFEGRRVATSNRLKDIESRIVISEEDRPLWEAYRDTVLEVLKDGVVSEDEYWKLSNVGFIRPEEYFYTGRLENELKAYDTAHPLLTDELIKAQKLQKMTTEFYDYLKTNYIADPLKLKMRRLISPKYNYDAYLLKSIFDRLSVLSDEDIGKELLHTVMYNNPYFWRLNFILPNGLGYLGFLDKNPDTTTHVIATYLIKRGNLNKTKKGDYIIPGTYDNTSKTIMTYNPQGKVFKFESVLADPNEFKKISNDFAKQNGYVDSPSLGEFNDYAEYASEYFARAMKKGGILKAWGGTRLHNRSGIGFNENTSWYNNVFSYFIDDLLKEMENALSDEEKDALIAKIDQTQTNAAKLWGVQQKFTDENGQISFREAFSGLDDDVKNHLDDINTNYSYINTKGIQRAKNDKRYIYYGRVVEPKDNPDQNWESDNWYSGQTADRTPLGKEGDYTDSQLTELRSKANKFGFDITLGDDKFYRLSRVINPVEGAADGTGQAAGQTPELKVVVLDPEMPEILKNDSGQWEYNADLKVWMDRKSGSRWYNPTTGKFGNSTSTVGEGALTDLEFTPKKTANYDLFADLLRVSASGIANKAVDASEAALEKELAPLQAYGDYTVPVHGLFDYVLYTKGDLASYMLKMSEPLSSDLDKEIARKFEANSKAIGILNKAYETESREIEKQMNLASQVREKYMQERFNARNFNIKSIIERISRINKYKAASIKAKADNVTDLTNYFVNKMDTKRIKNELDKEKSLSLWASLTYRDYLNRSINLAKLNWINNPFNIEGKTYSEIESAWLNSPLYEAAQEDAYSDLNRFMLEHNYSYPVKVTGGHYNIKVNG